MKRQNRIAKILSTTLTAILLFSQSLAGQQSTTQTLAEQPQAVTQQSQPQDAATPANALAPPNAQQSPQTSAPSGTTINPSQGPLQPVTTYPDASGQPQEE